MGFKERLKEKRLEAGLTQAELAEKVSVTTRTIQNYVLSLIHISRRIHIGAPASAGAVGR